jgi:IclR family transcriptional regulator, pca regulon regulatory protein
MKSLDEQYRSDDVAVKPATTVGDVSGDDVQFAFVRSLERGLAVIKSFGEGRGEQTIAEVAAQIGVDRSTARRFLLTLAKLGYVEQDGRDFRLSPQALQLGYAYLSSLPWWRSAQRELDRLRDRIGQNCAVGVLDEHQVVYVAYASAARFPVMNRSVGMQLPALSTAIGRLLLAHLEEARLHSMLRNINLERLTPYTLTNREALLSTLHAARAEGFAFVDQELELGLQSIGVPIRNRGGDVVAAISISLVGGQLDRRAIIGKYLPSLHEASAEITTTLPV